MRSGGVGGAPAQLLRMRDLLPEPLACARQRVGFKLRGPRVNLKEMFGAAMLALDAFAGAAD